MTENPKSGTGFQPASRDTTGSAAAEKHGRYTHATPRNGWLSRVLPIARALRHRNYQLFFFGQGTSLIGTWMQRTALSWLVYDRFHSISLLAVVTVCGQILTFPIAPFAGVLADRTDRRALLVATQAVAMSQAFLLAALTWSGAIQPWHIIGLSLMLGLVNAFDIPIRQSFVVEMVESRDDLPNAIALNSFNFNMARVFGPSLAGVLVAWLGEATCFLLNGLSFAAVIWALYAMRIKPRESVARDHHVLRNLKEGFHYVRRSTPIRSVLNLMTASSLFSMPYLAMMPIFAKDVFKSGVETQGHLISASGVGALMGAALLVTRKNVFGLGRIIAATSLLFGVVLVLFAMSPSLWLSYGLIAVVGFAMMVQNVSSNTLVQTISDDSIRGRVMSFHVMAHMGMAPLGSLLVVGLLAERYGPQWALAIGGCAYALVALGFAYRLSHFGRAVQPIYVKLGLVGESPPIGSGRVDLPSRRD